MPVCETLRKSLIKASRDIRKTFHHKGTYVCIEGPHFSTKAESNLYRSWGIDVIGMTNIPESKLAREAEICYSTMALITDYDCWKDGEKTVSVEEVISTLNQNIETVRLFIKNIPDYVGLQRNCECENSLKHAIITNREFISNETKKKLDLIIGKYL